MTFTHGASAYRNSLCRCDVCREANTDRAQRERADRFARLRADPSLAVHGSHYTYRNWGCRCDDCTRDHSRDCAERKRQRKAAAS